MAFNNRNLFDDFRFDGRWWIPGNPDAAVFGTLHYKPSIGIRLELMGTIGPTDIADRVSRWANSTEWDFILGLSDEGKKGTLQTVKEISGPLFPIPIRACKRRLQCGRSIERPPWFKVKYFVTLTTVPSAAHR
jgi:ApeA N-terminal domain 1